MGEALARGEAVGAWLITHPAEFGRQLGFTRLTALHDQWIVKMLTGAGDMTLQAHRGSYKTTAVGIAITIKMLLNGGENLMFIRKTDEDVKEVIRQVARNLRDPVTGDLYARLTGEELSVKATATTVTTSAYRGVSGAAQLLGIGTQSSITGKHADCIFTDDIVNLQDRLSGAERGRVKEFYHELRNVVNRGGRIVNTGTPWHRDDAFGCMPAPEKYDCYSTGLISADELAKLRDELPPSLFAANYELRHVASEDQLFEGAPAFTDEEEQLWDGVAHIDAAYGGEDCTAMTCGKRRGEVIYMYGRLWHGHVDRALHEILRECQRLRCGPIYTENNGDKGYLAREIDRLGGWAGAYHERQNKGHKIATYLRKWWPKIRWLRGTDQEYLDQILDYTPQAAHDDAPDSAACVCRYLD